MQILRALFFVALILCSTSLSIYLAFVAETTAFNLFVAVPILCLIAFAVSGYLIERRIGLMVSNDRQSKVKVFNDNGLLRTSLNTLPSCSIVTRLKGDTDKVA